MPTTYPQHDAMGLRGDGGHASLCPPYGLNLRAKRSNGLLSTACLPNRAVANLGNIFRKIVAGAFFANMLAATHSPRKNLALPHEKLRAFSLPQDLSVQLMFGAARFGEPASSVSHSLGFYIVPRGGDSPYRLDTPLKCFNQRLILDATRSFATPCGINACSGAVFREQWRACGRGLPLVCRKVPEVCRKTPSFARRAPDHAA